MNRIELILFETINNRFKIDFILDTKVIKIDLINHRFKILGDSLFFFKLEVIEELVCVWFRDKNFDFDLIDYIKLILIGSQLKVK